MLLLAELPGWFADDVAAAAQPLFNLDVAAAALLMFAARGAGLALLVFAWFVEWASGVARIYHFASVQDLFRAAEFAATPQLSHAVASTQALVLLLMVVCGAAMWRIIGRAENVGRHVASGAAIIALISLADVVNGSAQVLDAKDHVRFPVNVAGSPALNWGHAVWVEHVQSRSPMERLAEPKAYQAVQSWVQRHHGEGVLIVLVESLGLPIDPELRAWLQARVATPRTLRSWSFAADTEAFYGSTTYGELRVLCGMVGHYTRITEAEGSQCLPRRWGSAAQRPIGLHGFDLSFFARHDWWPKVGLVPWTFRGQRSGPAAGCNATFPGVCDAELLRESVRLAQVRGAFVYALTLDTHLPLSGAPIVDAGLERLCRRANVGPMVCQVVARLGVVLTTLESELAGMSERPFVVITGDHSPPFADEASRGTFDAGRVPLYLLKPLALAPT